MKLTRSLLVLLIAVALVAGAACTEEDGGKDPTTDEPTPVATLDPANRTFATNDPVERACDLDPRFLVRVWRGYNEKRSSDLTFVPQAPNWVGSFTLNSHTGPWEYLQRVPLVFYGPGHIQELGRVPEVVNTTSVYPTVGALTGVELPERDGRTLEEIVVPGAAPPKLIVTIMWDGVGRNVLERWPDRWPTLARLERHGASFVNATIGSTPSVTPATHATLGTGAFPRRHGITTIDQRDDEGDVTEVFLNRDMSDLRLTTYGDDVDMQLDQAPIVGTLGWVSWHLSMMSHGMQLEGGDSDEAVLAGKDGVDPTLGGPGFTTPDYAADFPSIEGRARELDGEDGELDGKWLDHDILDRPANPAWMRYQGDMLIEMLDEGAYGADAVTDLFFTNFKSTDLAGHHYTMDSREMAETLEAQDEQLGRMIRYLDRNVGDYVVILTADHGHTPSHTKTGAWPISNAEIKLDLAREFDVPEDVEFVKTSPGGLYFYDDAMAEYDVERDEIVEFLNDYTIAENAPGDIPVGYRERADEHVFSAAFLGSSLPEIMECAFGSPKPPDDIDA